MRKIGGTFDGTGAIVNVGIGFIPDKVTIWNNTDAEDRVIYWSRDFRVAGRVEGIQYSGDDDADMDVTPMAAAGGVKPYSGGATIATSTEANLVKAASPNKIGTLKTWTLDTSANRTGHWDVDALPAGVAVGSRILIDAGTPGSVAKWYTIEAITSDGGQADEVTLSGAAPSGSILYISGAFDYVAAPVGTIMPDGFTLAVVTNFNVDSDQLAFEAEQWDN